MLNLDLMTMFIDLMIDGHKSDGMICPGSFNSPIADLFKVTKVRTVTKNNTNSSAAEHRPTLPGITRLLSNVRRIFGLADQKQSVACSQQFRVFNEIASQLLQRQDGDAHLQQIINHAVDLTRADFGYFHTVNPNGEYLDVAAECNAPVNMAGKIHIKSGQGAAGTAWARAEPVLVKNYHQWSRRMPDAPLTEMRSALAVPIMRDGTVIGVLGLGANRVHQFNEDDQTLLSQLAQLSAVTLDNAELHAKTEKQLRESQLLAQKISKSEARYRELFITTEKRLRQSQLLVATSQVLNSSRVISSKLSEVSQVARIALECDNLSVFSLHPSTEEFTTVARAHSGREGSTLIETELLDDIETFLRERLGSTKQRSLVDSVWNTNKISSKDGVILNEIWVDTELWGVIAAIGHCESTDFDDEDRQVLSGVASQLSMVLMQKQLIDQVAHQANHDDLTALPNRRRFRKAVGDALFNYESTGQPFAIMLLDLDKFKAVNDNYGHNVGDRLLLMVGQRITAVSPANQMLARLGGDEFAVIMPIDDPTNLTRDKNSSNACDYSAQITAHYGQQIDQFTRELIDSINQPFEIDGVSLHIGISIGVSLCPRDGCDLSVLLQIADEAMYTFKRSRTPQITTDSICEDKSTGTNG